jgi:hypothetical protein
MSNGSIIKMSNGEKTRTFWLFNEGNAIEYTKEGMKEIPDFTKLFVDLLSIGYVEI